MGRFVYTPSEPTISAPIQPYDPLSTPELREAVAATIKKLTTSKKVHGIRKKYLTVLRTMKVIAERQCFENAEEIVGMHADSTRGGLSGSR